MEDPQCGSMDTKGALDNIRTIKLVCASYNAKQLKKE
jgi:hypothetical protein